MTVQPSRMSMQLLHHHLLSPSLWSIPVHHPPWSILNPSSFLIRHHYLVQSPSVQRSSPIRTISWPPIHLYRLHVNRLTRRRPMAMTTRPRQPTSSRRNNRSNLLIRKVAGSRRSRMSENHNEQYQEIPLPPTRMALPRRCPAIN